MGRRAIGVLGAICVLALAVVAVWTGSNSPGDPNGSSGNASREVVADSTLKYSGSVDSLGERGNPDSVERAPVKSPDGQAVVEVEQAETMPDKNWGEVLAQGEGTLDSLLEMLNDPDFVAACASPQAVDMGTLEDLSVRANRTLYAFINAEIENRIEAGLYTRDESYRPGEPYVTHGKAGEFLNYQMDGDEVKLVDLSREEYPWIYELQGKTRVLQVELGSRRQAAAR